MCDVCRSCCWPLLPVRVVGVICDDCDDGAPALRFAGATRTPPARATIFCPRLDDGRAAGALAAAGVDDVANMALKRRCTLPHDVGEPHCSNALFRSMPRLAITKTLATSSLSVRPMVGSAKESSCEHFAQRTEALTAQGPGPAHDSRATQVLEAHADV